MFSRRVQENIVAGLVLAVLLVFAGLSLTYSARARLVPLTVAIGSIALMVIQLLVQNLSRAGADAEPGGAGLFGQGGLSPDDDEMSPATHPLPPEQDETVTVLHEAGGSVLGGITVVAAFAVLILMAGVLPAALLFVFGYLRWVARASLRACVAYAVGTWGLLYLLFVVFLQVSMSGGYLGQWLPLATV